MWVNKTYQLKRSMSQSFTLFLFESISAPIFKASQAVGKLGSSNSGIERSQLKKLINETVNQQLSSLGNKADRNSLEFIFYTKFYFYWLISVARLVGFSFVVSLTCTVKKIAF